MTTTATKEMTVQSALGVELTMPAYEATQEAMYKRIAQQSNFKMALPSHPKDWTRPETVGGYKVRFANWLHKLQHHVHCRALEEVANAKRAATGSLNFKSGSINYETV